MKKEIMISESMEPELLARSQDKKGQIGPQTSSFNFLFFSRNEGIGQKLLGSNSSPWAQEEPIVCSLKIV